MIFVEDNCFLIALIFCLNKISAKSKDSIILFFSISSIFDLYETLTLYANKEPLKFDYFDIKHYVFKNVKGTLQDCEQAYAKECDKFPYFEFGTSVWERKKTKDGYEFLIGRFKSI